MKYLIVDDEPLAVIRLKKMLNKAGIKDIISANNGQQAIEMSQKHHPHTIFMDIEMPVLGGIQAAEQIKHISPESNIIFCTAYDNFAIKAFEISASDYLLKPVSQQRLVQALDKVSNADNENLTVKLGNDILRINFEDIYCFVSEQKNTFMHCQQGILLVDESLLTLESSFPHKLLRINRNALINIAELFGILRIKNKAFVRLKSTDYEPEISRRNLAKIKQQLI